MNKPPPRPRLFVLMEQKNRSGAPLTALSGVAALLDTLLGCFIVYMAVDPSRAFDLLFGISMVLGLPMFVLDVWLNKRFAYSLFALFWFRWALLSLSAPTLAFGNPFAWPTGTLLFVSFGFLQWSKLRGEST